MRRRTLLTLLWALSLAACGRPMGQGADEPATPTSAQNANVRHCHEERPLGSNIGRTVCRTDENIDGSREASREFMTRKRSAPTGRDGQPNTGGKYGGVPASAPGPRL